MGIYGKILLEYSGNPVKNAEFKEVLDEVDELITVFMKNIRRVDSEMDKILTAGNQILKSKGSYKTKLDTIKKDRDDYIDWQDDLFKPVNGQVTWRRLGSKVRTFNNKYSTVTMEEKKKLDKKLRDFLDELDKTIDPWCKDKKKVNKFIELRDKLKDIDDAYTESLNKIFCDYYDYLFNEVQATYHDIRTVIRDLNVNKENSLSYKFIQAILKK